MKALIIAGLMLFAINGFAIEQEIPVVDPNKAKEDANHLDDEGKQFQRDIVDSGVCKGRNKNPTADDQDIFFRACNLGGYSIKKTRVYFYNKAGDEVYRLGLNRDVTLMAALTLRIDLSDFDTALDLSNKYLRIKYKYWIAGGDTRSCSKVVDPNKFIVWELYTKGTTLNGNRCRDYKFTETGKTAK